MSETTPTPGKVERQERLPARDEPIELAGGIHCLQLPIALPGLGHVNCYALRDAKGITLVDPGLPDPETYTRLVGLLDQIDASVDDVHTVLVTHSHPDHFGGAGRLRIAHGADICAHHDFATIFDPRHDDSELESRSEAATLTADDVEAFSQVLMGERELEDLPERHSPWGGTAPGLKPEEIAYMRAWDDLTKRGFLTPTPSTTVGNGDHLVAGDRNWQVVHTPGHTGDHICLFDPDEGILLSGDHVLPTITPHISGTTPSSDALADFFAALQVVAGLPGVTNVLPAHGLPFTDLAGRVDEIERHHEERLSECIEIGLAMGTASVVEYSHQLFAERSWGAMAESETYAHLEHLRLAGRATAHQGGGEISYTIHT